MGRPTSGQSRYLEHRIPDMIDGSAFLAAVREMLGGFGGSVGEPDADAHSWRQRRDLLPSDPAGPKLVVGW